MRFKGLFVLRFSDFWVWGCARRIPAILVIIQPIAEQKYYVGALVYMSGCQNYGPFWVPLIIRHLLFRVPKKGPLILRTTHMFCPPALSWSRKRKS